MTRIGLGGLVVTVTVHTVLIAALLLAHRSSAEPAATPRNTVVATLVRLGKPRDPHRLPTKPTAPPPTTAPPATLTRDPNIAPTEPTPAPSPEAPPGDLFDSARLRAKALGETVEEPEGSPEGSPAGTAATASEGDPYATAIDAAIRAEWHLPDLVRPEDLVNLATTVFLRVDARGTIVETQVVAHSGNRFFDASVVEAIARTKRLPAPPADRLRDVLRGGITLVFRP